VVLLIGCIKDTGSNNESEIIDRSAADIDYQATLRLPLSVDISSVDFSYASRSQPQLWALESCIALPLMRCNANGVLSPGIASRAVPAEDYTSWSFPVDADAGWDAVEVARRYIEWLTSLLTREIVSTQQRQLQHLIAGGNELVTGSALDLSGVTYRDGALEFELTRPVAIFPLLLSQPGLGLYAEDLNLGYYTVERTEGNRIFLRANPASTSRPQAGTITFVCEPDYRQQLELYKQGELDAANLPWDMIASIRQDKALESHLVLNPTASMILGLFDLHEFPWNDGEFQSRVGLRRGLNHAIDKEILAETVNQRFEPWPHLLSREMRQFIDPALIQNPPYPLASDFELAYEELKEADHEQGLRLPRGMDLAYLPGEYTRKLANEVLSYWDEAAVSMQPYGEQLSDLAERIEAGSHEIVLKVVHPPYPDPDAIMYRLLHSENQGISGNWSYHSNERIDKLLNDSIADNDELYRQKIYYEITRYVEDNAVAVFLGSHQPAMLISPHLGGIRLGPYDFDASLAGQSFGALGIVSR
jgi:hypothetical protein